jgi:hypothetical protein
VITFLSEVSPSPHREGGRFDWLERYFFFWNFYFAILAPTISRSNFPVMNVGAFMQHICGVAHRICLCSTREGAPYFHCQALKPNLFLANGNNERCFRQRCAVLVSTTVVQPFQSSCLPPSPSTGFCTFVGSSNLVV